MLIPLQIQFDYLFIIHSRPSTKTLSVADGANITGVYTRDEYVNALIYSDGIDLIIDAPAGLTLNNSTGYGVYSRYNNNNEGGSITVKGNVTGTVAQSILFASKGVTVNGEVDLTHTATNGSYPIEANGGDVTITGKAKFNATGSCNEAVFANGSITVGGELTIEGSFKHGLYALDGDIGVNGNVTATVAESALIAKKGITVNGDVDITHTGTDGRHPIEANGGDVTITGKAKFNAAGSCFRAVYATGSITVGGNATVEGSFKHGLYAGNGNLEVTGNVTAAVAESGLYAYKKIIVNGDVDITHTGTDGEYPIFANEDVNIGGNAKFKATGSCARPVWADNITVGKDLTVSGSFTNGLYAANKVTVVSGTWDIDVSECAIAADGEIIIPETHEITTPAGGEVGIQEVETFLGVHDRSVITEADGTTVAKHVVIEPKAPAVSGVSLNKTSASMKVGATETLTAAVTPDDAENKNVTWTSSDESVATVADGVVTAVSEGTATITVTTEDGGFTATCAVTVTKKSSGGGGGGVTYYTLTFNTNGGSAISSVSGTYGKVIDLDKYVPTKSSFDFGGWYSDSALTSPVDEIKLTGNKTVYAKWVIRLPFTDVKATDWSYLDTVACHDFDGIRKIL